MLRRETENRADFMSQVQEFCSLSISKRIERSMNISDTNGTLRGLAVVLGDESAEFLFATDCSFVLRNEVRKITNC
jgi:hypothetical protein